MKETIEHIFEPYYTTKPQGEGTGLGLSLVHGIIKELGGTIEVDSEPGKGTVFNIYLPALINDCLPPQTLSVSLVGGNEHLLLVDDEVSLVEITSRKLKKLGYSVTARTSSVEAFEAFKANPDKFDMVITDLAMPNMTGLDMTIEMLKIKPELPVILTTGYVEVTIIEYAAKIGIKKIISKPIDFHEVTSAIRQVLREKTNEQ